MSGGAEGEESSNLGPPRSVREAIRKAWRARSAARGEPPSKPLFPWTKGLHSTAVIASLGIACCAVPAPGSHQQDGKQRGKLKRRPCDELNQAGPTQGEWLDLRVPNGDAEEL